VRYFEDFEVGDRHEISEGYEVTEAEIVEFARRYDPQPFHIDAEAAAASAFGGIVACTSHIFAMQCALGVKGLPTAAVSALGFDKMRTLAPVRPGDVLTLRDEVLACRRSESRPGVGIVTFRVEMQNRRDETVFSYENTCLIQMRHG
jgi:acyl dehydratase